MTFVLIVVTLSVVWAFVTGTFTLLNLLLGALIGAGAGLFLRERIERPHLLRRLGRVVSLALLFLTELALSAWRVAILVISPNMHNRIAPAIIAYPLTVQTDVEITLLANLITLTPGTLSVDVSDDRSVLYIHVLEMHDREETIASIRDGFEQKIIEVFQ
ncbi:MAG TPA: Na+/H+ antiporter subunit E [Pelagibacterium sp.]|uniref:Na+/H+ antiporter subunit E n=1 Tax=Pelagibacterium sp. TaxID=1967288 RepID=UPI002CD6BDAD|nr:Na+/H+ antiporter subunit E [Pelagibacterium sp.]HWJ87663.1 Na+/H+ antiporter subunit E [Pelagibacterium sp.]